MGNISLKIKLNREIFFSLSLSFLFNFFIISLLVSIYSTKGRGRFPKVFRLILHTSFFRIRDAVYVLILSLKDLVLSLMNSPQGMYLNLSSKRSPPRNINLALVIRAIRVLINILDGKPEPRSNRQQADFCVNTLNVAQ